MPTLKDWLQTESDAPPPFPPDPAEMEINRRQMRSLLQSSASPQAPADLSELQLVRAYERSGHSSRQIYKLIKQGTPVPRLANALGLAPELIQEIFKREQAVIKATGPARQALKLHESGLTFPQIGDKLKVSEAEARQLYAQGHVARYGANPAVQYGRREGTAFPTDVFEQPTYLSDANRGSPVIRQLVDSLRKQLEPQGYGLETFFEADALGGRHVVKVVRPWASLSG